MSGEVLGDLQGLLPLFEVGVVGPLLPASDAPPEELEAVAVPFGLLVHRECRIGPDLFIRAVLPEFRRVDPGQVLSVADRYGVDDVLDRVTAESGRAENLEEIALSELVLHTENVDVVAEVHGEFLRGTAEFDVVRQDHGGAVAVGAAAVCDGHRTGVRGGAGGCVGGRCCRVGGVAGGVLGGRGGAAHLEVVEDEVVGQQFIELGGVEAVGEGALGGGGRDRQRPGAEGESGTEAESAGEPRLPAWGPGCLCPAVATGGFAAGGGAVGAGGSG